MYSRSIGPNAARPSPRRENGVGPDPLSWMSNRAPSRRDLLTEQDGATIAQHREMRVLMPRIGLSERFRSWRQRIARKDRRIIQLVRVQAQSLASGRFSTTIFGSGTGVGSIRT
jgi:hypothetical protein